MIEELLEHGVDIDITNVKGETASHLAVKSRNENVLKLLFDRGANRKARGEKTEIKIGMEGGSESTMEILCH